MAVFRSAVSASNVRQRSVLLRTGGMAIVNAVQVFGYDSRVRDCRILLKREITCSNIRLRTKKVVEAIPQCGIELDVPVAA